eukprot:355578-Chlamydomonas_euryale.AAC.4
MWECGRKRPHAGNPVLFQPGAKATNGLILTGESSRKTQNTLSTLLSLNGHKTTRANQQPSGTPIP